MNCKNCQTELEEGVTLCPSCGTENAEPAKAGLGAGKLALLVVLAIAAIAVIVALVMGGGSGTTPVETTVPTEPGVTTTPVETTPAGTVPADGNPDDVTCKGSYTVTADQITAAGSTVVATAGEGTLTNEELQVYYWIQVIDFLNEYYSYASMFGLDLSQPLDTQISLDGTTTWQQYFLNSALQNWHHYQAMSLAATANGFELDQEYTDYLLNLPTSLEQSALSMGYYDANAMIQADMGPGANLDGYMAYLEDYYLGYMYYGQVMESLEITDAEIEAYFDEHADAYQANGLMKDEKCYVDVRHILITPSEETDEAWAAAETRANEVLNQWLAGTADEDSFAALAQTLSQDPGSASVGGLYENVYVGQMVEPFENWCFDAARQTGDYGIVKTSYGYHIMYFINSNPIWFVTAQEDMLVEKGNAFLEDVLKQYPATYHYSDMALGYVDLMG